MLALTKQVELLVSGEGLLPGEGQVIPAGSGCVQPNSPPEHFQVGRGAVSRLRPNQHANTDHHDVGVSVDHLDGETGWLR